MQSSATAIVVTQVSGIWDGKLVNRTKSKGGKKKLG
jgi:hypothetical protein